MKNVSNVSVNAFMDNRSHGDDQIFVFADDGRIYCGVADGVGGNPAGRIAASFACHLAEECVKSNAARFKTLDGNQTLKEILDYVAQKMKVVLAADSLREKHNWEPIVQKYLNQSLTNGWSEKENRIPEIENEIKENPQESPATTLGLILLDAGQNALYTMIVGDAAVYLLNKEEMFLHSPPKQNSEVSSYLSRTGLQGLPDVSMRSLTRYDGIVLCTDGVNLADLTWGYNIFNEAMHCGTVLQPAKNWHDNLSVPPEDDFSLITIRLPVDQKGGKPLPPTQALLQPDPYEAEYPPRDGRNHKRGDFTRLNLGCGDNNIPGYLNIATQNLEGVDMILDLETAKMPIPDNTVREVLVDHLLEHMSNFVPLMEEIYRVCESGAKIKIRVPYYKWELTFGDPAHRHLFTENSFRYFDPLYDCGIYSKASYKTKRTLLLINQRPTLLTTPIKRTRRLIPFRMCSNIYSEIYYELSVEKENPKPINSCFGSRKSRAFGVVGIVATVLVVTAIAVAIAVVNHKSQVAIPIPDQTQTQAPPVDVPTT